jgi:hypothetical protein
LPFSTDGGWRPIPELEPANYTSFTLIVIGNTGIAYPLARQDPIFPAQVQLSDGRFYNRHAYNAVLGCNDQTKFCTPDGEVCQSIQQVAYQKEWQKEDESRILFGMLSNALVFSSTNNAIRFRLADALHAQSNQIAGRSLLLDEEQWKVEVQRFFSMSLARIQITARNIARGAGTDLPNSDVVDQLPWIRGICGIYKFKSTGWKNLNVSGFLGFFFGGLFIIVLSFEREEAKELWFEKYFAAFYNFCKKKLWWVIAKMSR